MTENKLEVVFDSHGCFIYGTIDELFIETEQNVQLYYLRTKLIKRKHFKNTNAEKHLLATQVAEGKQKSLNLWHGRLMYILRPMRKS